MQSRGFWKQNSICSHSGDNCAPRRLHCPGTTLGKWRVLPPAGGSGRGLASSPRGSRCGVGSHAPPVVKAQKPGCGRAPAPWAPGQLLSPPVAWSTLTCPSASRAPPSQPQQEKQESWSPGHWPRTPGKPSAAEGTPGAPHLLSHPRLFSR